MIMQKNGGHNGNKYLKNGGHNGNKYLKSFKS